MQSFCTVEQYVKRYGSVSDTEQLQECLDDCTAVICARLDRAKIDYSNPSEDYADKLMRVCRSMCNRVAPDDSFLPAGVTQASIGAAGFSQSMTFSSTYGTPRLIESELDLLGISNESVGFYRMGGDWNATQ